MVNFSEADGNVSLYFHIPFCTRKCAYCHFYVLPDKDPLKVKLMEGLELEWKKIRPLLEGKKIFTIYFGGGTPSLIGPDNIAKILDRVRASIPFADGQPEITLEANPENITLPLMKGYADAGINRVSVGVQSLDSSLLRILDRTHDPEKAVQAIHAVHEAGISNISIDLMYDLPQQTLKAWETTLNQACLLPITHLSLYNLTIEPHTVFFKRRETIQTQLPTEEESLLMYELACTKLQAAGLNQYEISAFAKNNAYSRHNTGYWTGRPFLGLGPSAFSYREGCRYRNVANLNRYCKALEEGNNPVDFEETLTPSASLRELLAIRLRLIQGVDLAAFQTAHGRIESETMDTLNSLMDDGYLERADNTYRVSKKGILFYDSVASDLI